MSGAEADLPPLDFETERMISAEGQEGPASVDPPESNESRRALLFWKEGTNPSLGYVLPSGLFSTIGRDPTCAVSIFDKSLSRQHSVIKPEGESWALFDPGSANGSFLNGKKVRQATLHHGDLIRLGRIHLNFFEGDAGDPALTHFDSYRLAVRKKLVPLVERPDFIYQQLNHRLQPWMRQPKIMLVQNHYCEGETFEAFSIGTLVWPQDTGTLRDHLPVLFIDIEQPILVPTGKAAIVIPEIEPVLYLAGRIGQDVPLDPHTWGQRRMIVLEDHASPEGRNLSMGQMGKLDVLAAGGGQFDLTRYLPVKLALPGEPTVSVDLARLGRVVDEFESVG